MKILDVLSSTIPNVFKDKNPKKVAYKKKKSVYGGLEHGSKNNIGHGGQEGHGGQSSSASSATGGGSAGPASSGAASGGASSGGAAGGGAGGAGGAGH